jgi:hypothetical protein
MCSDALRDAIGYIRVSSEEQADSGLGLEAQRQRDPVRQPNQLAYCLLLYFVIPVRQIAFGALPLSKKSSLFFAK